MKESQDVGRATETVEALQQQLADLEAEFKAEVDALETRLDPLTEKLETVAVRPKKTDISVPLMALLWMPYWQEGQDKATPAWE
jgi:phage shock protein A